MKRILLPVSVRAMWEFESADWTTEIGFNHETFLFPNDRYAYMILLAVFDYRSARYVLSFFAYLFEIPRITDYSNHYITSSDYSKPTFNSESCACVLMSHELNSINYRLRKSNTSFARKK